MLRKLALVMALSPAMWLSTASALGLGEIDVTSALNQRFSATIPLTDLAPDEAESLLVGLAQGDAFDKAGVTRSDYLNTLTFSVKTDDGAPRIVISSKQIAREPTLNLLLDVRSHNARLQRAFTVLLDPPDYALPKPAVAAVAQDTSVAPSAAAPNKVQKKSPEKSAESGLGQPHTETGSYGPVAPGETLWSVASRLRTDPAITMDQMQLALYKANPKAFENGRIGSLLKGVMLQVPTEQVTKSVAPDKAKLRVQALRAGRTEPSRPNVKKPEVQKPVEAPKEEVKPTAPPPVAAPKPAAPAPAPIPKTEAPPVAPAPAVVKPIAPAPTKPVPAPAVNEAASAPAPSKLPVMAPSAASAVTAAEPASTVTTAAPLAETASAISSVAASGVVAEAASPVQTQQVEPVKPYIPPPIPEGPAPTPLFDDQLIKLGGGAAIVAGLLGWFILSRKKKVKQAPVAKQPFDWKFWKKSGKTEVAKFVPKAKAKSDQKMVPMAATATAAAFNEEQFERDFEATQQSSNGKFPSETQKLGPTFSDTSQLPNFDSTNIFDGPLNAPLPAINTDAVDFDVTSQFQAETLKIDLDSNDPVAEADFHLAYGLYDEAALQLKQAAQKHPERTDIPTKLAEVYFRAGKAMDFQEIAESLKPKLAQAEWAKIALMGKQLNPDAPLYQGIDADALATDMDMAFDEPAPAAVRAPAAKTIEPSMDFELTSLDLPKVEEPHVEKTNASNSLEFNLEDFKLDQPTLTATTKAAPAPAAASEAPLEFDLSSFDLGSEEPVAGSDTQLPNVEGIRLDDFDLGMPDDSHAISTGDEASTKLDLARAYVDMGDNDMARSLLNEVAQQGDAKQKTEAQTLLGRLA